MKRNINDVINLINKKREVLRDTYRVKNIGIFGSVARGESTKKSDVDVLVEFSLTPSLFKFIDLENFLRQILKMKVDLVTKNALKPAIKDQILQEVIYV